MEFREILNLFYKEKNLYLGIIFVCLGVAWAFLVLEPVRYQASTLLTVARTEFVPPTEYSYDNFYRLQADEKYSDTVVRLLATPEMTKDIFERAELGRTEGGDYFDAKRMSSQVVVVQYESESQEELQKIAPALPLVVNEYTSELNAKQNEGNWFRVIAQQPVITDARTNPSLVWALAVFFGVFIGFWTVLAKHYLTYKKP